MTTQATIKQRNVDKTVGYGSKIQFEDIHEPGAYVFNGSGHLLRVPEEGCQLSGAHEVSILANEPIFVTKVSDDPFIAISKARSLAGDCDLDVHF
jgi:hypothetical protein